MTKSPDDRMNSRANRRAFEHPDEDAGLHQRRQYFFEVVHRLEPRVSAELMDEPLKLYRPMFNAAVSRSPSQSGLGWRWWESAPTWSTFKFATESHDPPEALCLRDLLLRWSHKWRLEDDWCLEAAVETLAEWSAEGDDPEPRPLYYLGTQMIEIPFNEEELRFSFSHRGWSPTLETWETAKEWIDDGYREALKEYKERVERLSRERGLVPVRQTKHRVGDHMEWLARVVLDEDEYDRIAADHGSITRQAVSKAVRMQAREIGLESIPELRSS